MSSWRSASGSERTKDAKQLQANSESAGRSRSSAGAVFRPRADQRFSHTLFGNYPLTSTGIRVDNYSADCNYVFRRAVEIIAQNMAKICRYWRLMRTDAAGKRSPSAASITAS